MLQSLEEERYYNQMRYHSPTMCLKSAKVLSIGGAGIPAAIDLALVHPESSVRSMEADEVKPIATENHQLVTIKDINKQFPPDIKPCSLDFVRATKLGGRIQNWGAFLFYVYRALKPGGYIELCDSSKQFSLDAASVWHSASSMFDSYGKTFGVCYNIVSRGVIQKHLANTGFHFIQSAPPTYVNLDSQKGFSYAQTVIEELELINCRKPGLAPYGWDVFTKDLENCRRDATVTLYVCHSCCSLKY